MTHLLLTEVIWQIGDHDLGCRWNAILRWATLLWLAGLALSLLDLSWSSWCLIGLGVGDISQWQWLNSLALGTLTTSTSDATATATTTSASTTSTRSTLAFLATAFTTCGRSGLLTSRFWLASELDRDLTLEDLLARQVGNGLLRLFS